jgi:hypothetical protein
MKKLTLEDFKRWGSKGGKKRTSAMSKAQRSAVASTAAKARWKKAKKIGGAK